MATNGNRSRYGLGAAVCGFLCALIVLSKVAFLVRANAAFGEFVLGMLPALLVALCCFGAYLAVANWRRPWVRNIGKLVVVIVTLILAGFTIVAAAGFWKTGSIPRLQQFEGLTWDIIAPSVLEMLHKNMPYLVLAVLVSLALIWLLGFSIKRTNWHRLVPYYFSTVALVALALIVVAIFGSASGATRNMDVIASRFFRVDIDLAAASSHGAKLTEAKFFKTYRDKLQQKTSRRYPDIYSLLKGSNIIYVVLESTRAKDVPLYGGPAVMPHLMQARQHMILFQHLYSQDPRSTKAFAEMDMGRFSLLSWNSYSNNIPWMFPQDGIASHLDKLGYRTFSLVNSDRYYDHNKNFQEHHGYQTALFRQALNPGSPNADDLKLLARVKQELSQVDKPFYMMVWPIETHHPYGRGYWADKGDWESSHPGGTKHRGAADHARYLQALHEVDDWFARLIQVLKDEGKYENTVIIVTGDHGEAFGEHEPGNVFHGNGVYQESVHVTGFIYSPKIQGMQVDDRNLRLVDMPATILDLASGGQYILNAGRSIFYNYKYAMPVYLFNSWAGAAGIIYDGYKLWRRERPGSPVYFASMADIRANPAMERHVATGKHDQTLLKMLDTWEVAMKAKTAALLTTKDKAQPPIDDVLRIYCDDGKGFREALKDAVDFTGAAGTVRVPMNKSCRSIRIAPISDTKITDGKYLDFDIESLHVVADDRSWGLPDVKLVWSNNVHVVSKHEFRIPSGSAAFDYRLGARNHHIRYVEMTVKYTWERMRGEQDKAVGAQ